MTQLVSTLGIFIRMGKREGEGPIFTVYTYKMMKEQNLLIKTFDPS